MKNKPHIFDYFSYRDFLRDLYGYLKETKPHFSYRYFSQKAGFKSQSVLKQVMTGKRNLAYDSILKFSAAFGLNEKEAEYFKSMVFFNQTKDHDEKNKILLSLLQTRSMSSIKKIAKQQFTVYENWYNAAIRELVSTKEFRNDPQWVAGRFKTEILPREIKKAIGTLIEAGLLLKDGSGNLKATDAIIQSDPDVKSVIVRNFNIKMAELGMKAITDISPEEREISGITFSCSKAIFETMKTKIRNFKEELMTQIAEETAQPEEVYQFNVQLFPLTNSREKP